MSISFKPLAGCFTHTWQTKLIHLKPLPLFASLG